MALKVICVNKDHGYHANPHEAISLFGWIEDSTALQGKYTLSQMVMFLDRGGVAYTTTPSGNRKAYLETFVRNSMKFVRTIADGTTSDNLLSLSECRVW